MAESLQSPDSFWQNNRLKIIAIGLFFSGLFFLAFAAGLFFFKQQSTNDDIQIISSASPSSDVEIVVDVDGAVRKPGVYRLPSGLRVSDAIYAAGGFTGDADRRNLNLAAKISDGQKIYVPSLAEAREGKSSQNQSGLVNINTASEAELDKLPGIGPATAQKIIAARPYSAKEDLLAKKAVTASTFEKIKDLISVF